MSKLLDWFFGNEEEERGEEQEESMATYSEMLGFNKEFAFILTKDKVKDKAEFDMVANDAKSVLIQDLRRMGTNYYEIEPALRNRLSGVIGSMTLVANDTGNLSVKFHRRDNDGLWDGTTKKFPEKNTTGKFKYEIFFIIEDDDEED